MSVDGFFKVVQPIFDFMRNYQMNLFGFEFTFMDMFVWTFLATIVLWFIFKLRDL